MQVEGFTAGNVLHSGRYVTVARTADGAPVVLKALTDAALTHIQIARTRYVYRVLDHAAQALMSLQQPNNMECFQGAPRTCTNISHHGGSCGVLGPHAPTHCPRD